MGDEMNDSYKILKHKHDKYKKETQNLKKKIDQLTEEQNLRKNTEYLGGGI